MKEPKIEDLQITTKQEKVANQEIFPIKEEEFDTLEKYEKECSNKSLSHPWESATQVSQGGFKLYEGKPLQSSGFTRCSGVILESSRALGLIHVDPMEFWKSNWGKIKKYFEGEKIKITVVKGDSAWRWDDIYYDLKQMGVIIYESKVIHVPSTDKRWWAMSYDPTDGEVAVHCVPEYPKQKVLTFDTGESRYSAEAFNDSREFFESRDYMPKGYRLAEKYFAEQNFKLEEWAFKTWEIDPGDTLEKVLRFKDGDTLVLWTPDHGFIEKNVSPSDIVAEAMLPEWNPARTFLFIKHKYEKEDNSEYDGFVSGYVPSYQLASLYYEVNHLLTREVIRERAIATHGKGY